MSSVSCSFPAVPRQTDDGHPLQVTSFPLVSSVVFLSFPPVSSVVFPFFPLVSSVVFMHTWLIASGEGGSFWEDFKSGVLSVFAMFQEIEENV